MRDLIKHAESGINIQTGKEMLKIFKYYFKFVPKLEL